MVSITTRNRAIGHRSGITSVKTVSFQQNSPHDAQEMGERQDFANVLRPARHPAKREHIAGQQQRRQEEEKRHLHRLKLVLGDGREGDADGEVRHDEQKRQHHQQRHAARQSAR